MPRRPLPAAAAAFAAGIAYQHLAADALTGLLLGGVCVLLPGMLFSFCYEWNKIALKEINDASDPELAEYLQEERRRRLRLGRRVLSILTVFFLMGAGAGHFSENRVSQLNDLTGKSIVAAGRILSSDIRQDYCLLVMSVTAAAAAEEIPAGDLLADSGQGLLKALKKEASFHERVLLRAEGMEGTDAAALTGRIAVVQGIPEAPSGASNPGTFDYGQYLRTRKIHRILSVQPGQVLLSDRRPEGLYLLLYLTAKLRYAYEQRMAAVLAPEAAQLLAGILFGDDGAMDEELKDGFQKNGLAHLLAASGLHAGFVYGLLRLLLGKPATLRGALPMVSGLVFYAALAGFSPSVIRAVFMIMVRMAARILHRPYDFLSCIAFCLLVMLLWEPLSLFSAGVQLSFLAVLTLSVVHSRLAGFSEGFCRALGDRRAVWARPVLGAVCGTAALQFGMTPLTLVHFHYLSPAGLLLNGPAIFLAGLIVPCGILLMPLAFAGGPPAAFFSAMEELLIRLLLFLNQLTAGTPLSFHYAPSPPPGLLLLYYILLFFFCSETGAAFRRSLPAKRLKALGLAGVLLVSGAFGFAVREQFLLSDLIFVDVGQGDCAHLKAGRADILFDTGGGFRKTESAEEEGAAAGQRQEAQEAAFVADTVAENTLLPYLLGNGVGTLDAVVLSHLHQDHCGALATLARGVRIRCLILPGVYASQAKELSRRFGIPEKNMIFAWAGQRIRIGTAELAILSPAPCSEREAQQLLSEDTDENRLCMSVKASCRGKTVLFTGDIDEEGEQWLTARYGPGAPAAAGDGTGSLLKTDILKVAHHGSRFSSTSGFLATAEPSVSVIQVGRNYYGHPSGEAMERIAACGSRIYRNDTQGAVMIRLGRCLKIRTMKGGLQGDCG